MKKRKNSVRLMALLAALVLGLAVVLTACRRERPPENPIEPPPDDPVTPTYALTFDSRGGSLVADVPALEEGAAIVRPSNPAKEFFTFTGWYTEPYGQVTFDFGTKMPGHDLTLYAGWTADRFVRIRFDSAGSTDYADAYGVAGAALTLPVPEKELYVFDGWYTSPSYTQKFTAATFPAADTDLFAKWNLSTAVAQVTYRGNGNVLAQRLQAKGTAATIPTDIFPAGMTFDGKWYINTQLTQEYTGAVINADTTLYTYYYSAGLENEAGRVTGYTGDNDVIIPDKLNGVAVTKIDAFAFAGETITSVTIPAAVTEIGQSAFANCAYLRAVALPAGLTTLGAGVFSGCVRLTAVNIPNGVEVIPVSAFAGCFNLVNLQINTLTTSLRTVGAYAFADCAALTAFPTDAFYLTVIGDYAFSGCVSLTTLKLTAKIETLGAGAFRGCIAIAAPTVAGNKFKLDGGNLYTYDGNTLLYYFGAGKAEAAFTVGADIWVAASAFVNNQNLTSLDLSAATVVEEGALQGSKKLETLTIKSLRTDYLRPAVPPQATRDTYLAAAFGAPSAQANGVASLYTPVTLRTVSLTAPGTGIGDDAFYGAAYLTAITGLSDVATFGRRAFAYTGITAFTFSSTVTTLNDTLFEGCYALTAFSVNGNGGLYRAQGGSLYTQDGTKLVRVPTGMTSFTFAPAVTTLGANAFVGGVIQSLVIPTTVTTVEAGALKNTLRLTDLTVPFIGSGSGAEETDYFGYIFGAPRIASFSDLNNAADSATPPALFSVTVTGDADGIIPAWTFALCDIAVLNLPANIYYIGDYAFVLNQKMTELVIPDGVKHIGEGAYFYDVMVRTLDIPGSVEFIGAEAFGYMLYLETVVVHEGVRELPELAFEAYTEGNGSLVASSLVEVSLPASLERIGDYAFELAGLFIDEYTAVKFTFENAAESKLAEIGEGAFVNAGVDNITLPASVTQIGAQAFAGASILTRVTVGNAADGSSLASIGAAAFQGAVRLETLTLYGAAVPTFGGNAFPAGVTLYVDAFTLAAYKASAAWTAVFGTSILPVLPR
jgi:uncharacterized repeat protein (TIGR02543 family)